MKPERFLDGLNVPTMIILGEHDEMIDVRGARSIFEGCPSKLKTIRFLKGDHNSDRSNEVVKVCGRFVL